MHSHRIATLTNNRRVSRHTRDICFYVVELYVRGWWINDTINYTIVVGELRKGRDKSRR